MEKKAACIYSQLKRCSSSEVAAMIEGVLRHCTTLEIEQQYVDSHGQSEVAFAFCYLLGFANLATTSLPPVGTEDDRTGSRRRRHVPPVVHASAALLASIL